MFEIQHPCLPRLWCKTLKPLSRSTCRVGTSTCSLPAADAVSAKNIPPISDFKSELVSSLVVICWLGNGHNLEGWQRPRSPWHVFNLKLSARWCFRFEPYQITWWCTHSKDFKYITNDLNRFQRISPEPQQCTGILRWPKCACHTDMEV